MHPANERLGYILILSLTGQMHRQNDSWMHISLLRLVYWVLSFHMLVYINNTKHSMPFVVTCTQRDAIITRSNITSYWLQQWHKWQRIEMILWVYDKQDIQHPPMWTMGHLWALCRKWSHHNGTTLISLENWCLCKMYHNRIVLMSGI